MNFFFLQGHRGTVAAGDGRVFVGRVERGVDVQRG